MTTRVQLFGAELDLRPSGTVYWPARHLLVVSDLHLGKSGRLARKRGALLPPYETRDTIRRLARELAQTAAETVICLGDSFDDPEARSELSPSEAHDLARTMAGRQWIWIEGNHDPGDARIGGSTYVSTRLDRISFRHIAQPSGRNEISGHYHPKLRLKGTSRNCFLIDKSRLILPAFGTYTGGLNADHPVFAELLADDACAVLTGPTRGLFPIRKTRGPFRPPAGVFFTKKKSASSL